MLPASVIGVNTTATDTADLLRRFENLLMAIVRGGHTCGFVYTQL